MKKILMTLAAVLCCAMTIEAQGLLKPSKMSPWLRGQYRQQQEAVKQSGGRLRAQGRPVMKYMLTLVESTDQAQSLREKGGVVLQDFGEGICAAFVPMDSLGVMEQSSTILRMEANTPPILHNDTSAVILGADKLWNGQLQLPQAFTGKGVIAAVMDVGFDFTHPAFRNDDGTSRIKWFWDPTTPDANNDTFGMMYATPAEVLAARHSINADEDYHGTHVLGSMAGDGLDGRYVGMAPEADIMGANLPMGQMNEEWLEALRQFLINHILGFQGVKDAILQLDMGYAIELVELFKIFQQADVAGQPCVVNWSFGTSPNFYDDGTLYEQVFNRMVGPGRIVVTSAGNSGGEKTYVEKDTYTPMEQEVYYSGRTDRFYVDLRADMSAANFRVGVTLRDVPDTLFFDSRDAIAAAQAGDTLIVMKPEVAMPVFVDALANDKVAFEILLLPRNDYAKSISGENGWMQTEGKILIDAPVEVQMMGCSVRGETVAFSKETPVNSRGCHDHTLGFPANMERIIAVGAMHHRSQFTNIRGEANSCYPAGSQEGTLVSFSSCGPTLDGRVKPDVVAPGHNILSALNSFYRVNHNMQATFDETIPLMPYYKRVFGNEYAVWAMSGTSMSSPITAGIVALWLQAKPDLTPEDILGVIERTSHQPEPDFSGTDKNVYYGWGEIDAYAGLLDILGLTTAIPDLSSHQPAGVTFRLQGRTLHIDGADDGTPVRIYTTDGRLIAAASLAAGTVILPATAVTGVFAVQVGKQGSTLIRM